MAEYPLIKFNMKCLDSTPIHSMPELSELIEYCSWFAELGFARSYEDMPRETRDKFGYPDRGSEGNLSFRAGNGRFVVSGSQLPRKSGLENTDFAEVVGVEFQGEKCTIAYKGARAPSSESMLHDMIYRSVPQVNAVFHGHGDSMVEGFEKALKKRPRAGIRGVSFTEGMPAPGTKETPDMVLEALRLESPFVVIRGHGFVSVGGTMKAAFSNYKDGVSGLKEITGL